jgi:precorrin-8X/cobalt-precorrin-8 methylmutase
MSNTQSNEILGDGKDGQNYTDIGVTTSEALAISRKSRKIISNLIGDSTLEDKIRQRCVIAAGDPSVSEILEFRHDPIQAGLRALKEGARKMSFLGL